MTENNKEQTSPLTPYGEALNAAIKEHQADELSFSLGWQAAYTLRHNEAPKACRDAFEKWVDLDNPSSGNFIDDLQEAFIAGYEARHNEAPTGEIGELIERISEHLNCYNSEVTSPELELFKDCKAQLQQAQKMKKALEIANRCINNGDLILKGSAYDTIIKQALNNKG